MKTIFIGTSGYNYKHWKGDFYPEGLAQKKWMEFYSQQFTSVEINATFYRSFQAHVYAHWYEITDPEFTFTLKGPRTVTHIKRLTDVHGEIEGFFMANAALKEKLSSVLWQFPASLKNDPGKLELFSDFLKQLPKTIRQVVEFRHNSWFTDAVYVLLREHNVGFVINDSSRFHATHAITADFVYIRFHGPRALYSSSYTDDQLAAWSDEIINWLSDKDVYCYFNNDLGGHAFQNARDLAAMVVGNQH